MYHSKNIRKKRAQLFFVYGLMAVAVVVTVVALVLVMLGYRFNRYDGTIEQGGLVQFDSKPSGATVMLDDITLANRTASKVTAQTGSHTITMTKDGYTSWRKDVMVQPGSVLWLNYALLLPTKPTIKTVATFPAVADAIVSPDRKYVAALPGANDPSIIVTPLNADEATPTRVTLALPDYTAPDEGFQQVFDLVGWDFDGRYMLVRHVYGEAKEEYLSVDLRGADPVRNISKSLGVDIRAVEYSLASSNTLYLLTATHEVRRADLSATTLSGPLITNVESFAQSDRSTVTYTTLANEAMQRSVGYLTSGAAKPRVARTYTDEGAVPAWFRTGTYYGQDYTVTAHGTTIEILRGDVPSSDASTTPQSVQVAKYDCPSNVTYVDFSPVLDRFVVARCGNDVATYDLETLQLARATVPADQGQSVQWIDKFHWSSTASGNFDFYDFDGTNRQTVATGTSVLPATLSENNKYYYHFAPQPTGVALVRTKALAD
ncbi:hypothetical protein B7Z00_04380 [Candidatus Saccharibacteria bacterium 32-50-10]|nr:MAG: hypothetical protein B7Z00_04380 [Candidatus Saccharibacteria bacterium 32-50-10]